MFCYVRITGIMYISHTNILAPQWTNYRFVQLHEWNHNSNNNGKLTHYGDVIMRTIASQITSLTVVNSTVYSDADQRKHPVNSPHKGPVTRKMLQFDDVIMSFNDSSNLYFYNLYNNSHTLLMVILLQTTLVKITNLQLAHVRCKWTEYLKCFLQLFGLLWDISRFPGYL